MISFGGIRVSTPGPQGPIGPQGQQGDPGNVEIGYVESVTPFTAGTTAPSTGNPNVADIPGMTLAVTAGSRPFYLWAYATGQLGKGTGVTGGYAQQLLRIYDTSDMSVAIGEVPQTVIIAASAIQSPLPIAPVRVSLPPGTSKTYKLTAYASALPAGNAASLQVPNTASKIRMGAILG